jgi:hypothetical protein
MDKKMIKFMIAAGLPPVTNVPISREKVIWKFYVNLHSSHQKFL